MYWCAGTPHFSFLFSLLLLLLLYNAVPKALKLSTLWYGHDATAVARQVCVDHCLLSMRVLKQCMRECAVCAVVVCVDMRGSADLFCVLAPRICSALFFCLLCSLAAAAAVSCLCHTVPRALELSTLWHHGTTAVAQHVCVDYFYACVDITYACV